MADSPRAEDAPDSETERLRRLEVLLARRGLPMRRLATGRGHVPEELASASRAQRRLVAHAKGFPWAGPDGCAAWVEGVFQWFGLGLERGDARALYARHCTLADPGDLRVGMIVAVPLFAVLYDLLKRLVRRGLIKNGCIDVLKQYNEDYHEEEQALASEDAE